MTPLGAQLIRRIESTGPLTVADYMLECLLNPHHGYYTTRDPLGTGGDFVTAPEISQMFGELIGLFLAQCWIDRGRPAPFQLVELGPGRGTLMADLMRATAQVPGFHDAARLHLVEASPVLRKAQSATIPHPITHHDRLDDVPDGPLYLVANEFFDALPIRQFLRDGGAWRERLVGLSDGKLSFGLSDPIDPPAIADRKPDTKQGALVEHCPAAQALATIIGARIAASGGVALVVDYGDAVSLGDTFQAVRNHEKVSPLDQPGTADLTAHVDFGALAGAAHPAAATPLCPQGAFLERLGITPRAQTLARSLEDKALSDHIAAHRRLTHPKEMGTLFKAMALFDPTSPMPPGYSE